MFQTTIFRFFAYRESHKSSIFICSIYFIFLLWCHEKVARNNLATEKLINVSASLVYAAMKSVPYAIASKQRFTCSKSKIEVTEKRLKYVQS